MKITSLLALSLLLSVAVANTEPNTPEVDGTECGLCMWGTEKIEEYLYKNYDLVTFHSINNKKTPHSLSRSGGLCFSGFEPP